MAVLFLGRK